LPVRPTSLYDSAVPHTSSLHRLMQRVRPHAGRVALASLAAAIAAGAAAVWARILGPLLTTVLAQQGAADLRWKLPALIVAVAVAKALAQWLHTGLMQSVAQRVLSTLRHDLYAKLLSLPPSWLEQRHSGELLSRFTSDVAALELTVSTALSSYVKDTLTVIALLAVCAAADLRLFALAFLVVPAMVWPVSRFARSLKRTASSTQASLAALTQLTAEQLHNLPVVQAYRAEAQSLERFDAEQRRYLASMKRSLFVRGAFTPTLEMLGVLAIALCLVFGARAVALEPTLASALLSFLAAALLMYQPLKGLSGTFSEVMRGLTSAERLFEVLGAQAPKRGTAPAGPLRHALELENVRLIYPDGRVALDGLTLTVKAGATVALVGKSGAGKSSVLSLVLGLAHPTSGRITWDGADLSSLALGSQAAWVSQEPLLLSGTVRENLRLGRAEATDTQLWQALERANARSFVEALPRQLDEEVGERGRALSGGQRQRLAIARAFLLEPSLLLLDEPTSSLDEAAQAEVQKGLKELSAGRTVLLVAHRLSTVEQADEVCVLESGRVVETGRSIELRARGGAFATLGGWHGP
jgi:subfamily B ATP-binding cassette protein MsbA